MPSINMIASRRSEKKRLENNMRRLLALILVEVVVGVTLGLVFTVRIWNTRNRIADLNVDLARLQPDVSRIQEYEKATAKLAPKLDLLNDAKSQTLRWYNLMAKMSQVMPSDTWLTRLNTATDVAGAQKGDGGALTVNITGMSVSQNKVGDAMLNLNSYQGFQRVDLNYTQKASVGTLQTVEFQVEAVLKADKAKGGSSNATGKS